MRIALILAGVCFYMTGAPANAMEMNFTGAWQIETVAGVDDLDPSKTEFVADDDGVAMTVGCNRMRAKPRVERSSVRFGPVAGTLMLCRPPLDAVEKGFHKALEAARSFVVDGRGENLMFLNETGETIITMSKKVE